VLSPKRCRHAQDSTAAGFRVDFTAVDFTAVLLGGLTVNFTPADFTVADSSTTVVSTGE